MPGEKTPLPLAIASHKDSASISLRKIADWDGESQDIYEVVTAAFEAPDYLSCIKDLQAVGINAKTYINSLDKIIDALTRDPDLQRRCIRALRKTCGIYGILPASYAFAPPLTRSGTLAIGTGGFADVWKYTDPENKAYAVKALRVYEKDPVTKINKKYCKEVIIQKRMMHDNVLTIEGVARDVFEFCMVSQWMENGDLLNHLETNPEANRLDLLIGITRGLDYLHRNDVIHGDLKSSNILIDAEGRPRLSDFGQSSITINIKSVHASTPNGAGTVRYRAPELLAEFAKRGGIKWFGVRFTKKANGKKAKCTKKADVYSLSMVIVELATGEEPFPTLQDHHVTLEISKGVRPKKPHQFEAQGITSEVWEVAKKCWRQKASKRPAVEKVLQILEKVAEPGDEQPEPSKLRKALCHIL